MQSNPMAFIRMADKLAAMTFMQYVSCMNYRTIGANKIFISLIQPMGIDWTGNLRFLHKCAIPTYKILALMMSMM